MRFDAESYSCGRYPPTSRSIKPFPSIRVGMMIFPSFGLLSLPGVRRGLSSLALASSLASGLAGAQPPARAGDTVGAVSQGTADEHSQLALVMRELNLLDRVTEHAAASAPQERARYHFDYARLRRDLQRVRTGIHDYLVPQRAQPRDPVPMAGDYVRHDAAPGQKATTP